MRRLEKKYERELVVIGVHSAKFDTESNTENIRQAILRHGLKHPVVNDAGFRIWRQYGVNAWPTLVLIGPDGRVIDSRAGEITFEAYDPVIADVLKEYDAVGQIDRWTVDLQKESEREPERPLFFPAKVLADPVGKRLFVADTGHHRVLAVSLTGAGDEIAGVVEAVIGRGEPAFADGGFTEAAFNEPRGMALEPDGQTLYVADTENHAIRAIRLDKEEVETVAGTGEQSRHYGVARGAGRQAPLSSPWDVLLLGEELFIAMAGSHQIWALDPASGALRVHAGTGREALIDGPLQSAALNQPSGLATDGRFLYIADSEASAIRRAGLTPGGRLETIIGTGLFDFGDADGKGHAVRLQHPLGLAFWPEGNGSGGKLVVADTYNNKIKLVDPVDRSSVTFLGTGKRELLDGAGVQAGFNEPGGLSVAGSLLYVADTDNHAIRVADLTARQVGTLNLKETEAMTPVPAAEPPEEEAIEVAPQTVVPGEGTLEISVELPPGHKLSLEESFYFAWESEDPAVVAFPDQPQQLSGPHPQLPLKIRARFSQGQTDLRIEMTIFYCPEAGESLCLLDAPLIRLPVRVNPGAPGSSLTIRHQVIRED